jgi:hypothetical protein
MKNLIKRAHFALYILLTAVLFVACDGQPQQYVQTAKDKPYYIIEKVETSNSESLAKYKYTVRDENGKVKIWLNDKYAIGDTLCVVAYCR